MITGTTPEHPGYITIIISQRVQWADINGDGKDDMLCDSEDGEHWA